MLIPNSASLPPILPTQGPKLQKSPCQHIFLHLSHREDQSWWVCYWHFVKSQLEKLIPIGQNWSHGYP